MTNAGVNVIGLKLTARVVLLPASLVLAVALSLFARLALGWDWPQAGTAGLVGVLLHWLVASLHHLGHALSAKTTGFNMSGIDYGKWGLLAISIYPDNEPQLRPGVHARRALGGPVLSSVIGLIVILAASAQKPMGLDAWLGLFAGLDSLLVFGLGSLLPLGFTDGSTLLRLWRQRQATTAGREP